MTAEISHLFAQAVLPLADASGAVWVTVLGAMGALAAAVVLALLVLVVAGFIVRARAGDRLAWSGTMGAIEAVLRPLARFIHRTKWEGFDRFTVPEGGFVIVANHASGLDPPLMQFAVPRRVRFMMATEQMHPMFSWFWGQLRVLPVSYTAADAVMFREAVRHVKGGGVVGVFPEVKLNARRACLRPLLRERAHSLL